MSAIAMSALCHKQTFIHFGQISCLSRQKLSSLPQNHQFCGSKPELFLESARQKTHPSQPVFDHLLRTTWHFGARLVPAQIRKR
jgi:hypothetical protein